MGVNWHRLNRVLHRDIGYLAAGMTLLYALTGILLNHIHDTIREFYIEPHLRVHFVKSIPEGCKSLYAKRHRYIHTQKSASRTAA